MCNLDEAGQVSSIISISSFFCVRSSTIAVLNIELPTVLLRCSTYSTRPKMVACYYKKSDQTVNTINSGVCSDSRSASGFFSCCFPWDECLPNSICYSKEKTTFYTSLCTDQTYQDSACQKACSMSSPSPPNYAHTDDPQDGVYLTDLTYNSSTSSWACCNGDTACSTSSNDTFDAPAPELLRQQTMAIYDLIPTATSSSSSRTPTSASTGSTTDSTSTASSAAIPSINDNSSTSLSAGAKAGVGVGVTIGVLLIIAAIALLLLHKSKRRRNHILPTANTLGNDKQEIDGSPVNSYTKSTPFQYPAEVPGTIAGSELDSGKGGGHRPQELP
jgi:hypothetical protein